MIAIHCPGRKKIQSTEFGSRWEELKVWGGNSSPPQKNVWNKRCKSTQLHDAFIGHARQRHDYASH